MAKSNLPLQKNIILAELIKSWSVRHKVTDDPYINGLVKALVDNNNLAMWASIDALSYLPHPRSTSEDGVRKVYRRLNALRNTLVFAPVALTWLAVGQATAAFKEFVDKNTTATVNFLEFWQNGYDTLGSEWRLSSIAFLDFMIVFSVILITILTNTLSDRSEKRLTLELDDIERERLDLGLAIKEYLYTKQTLTRATLNAGVGTAIENLILATENLQAKSSRKRKIR